MSRDRSLEPERTRPSQGGDGRDLPRGGRSGTKARPQAVSRDVRDALVQQLDLPRGEERQRVWTEDKSYDLRGSEVRTLAAIGAFRVIQTDDAPSETEHDRWNGDLRHLREAGLVEFTPKALDGHPTTLVALTREGRELLERHQRTQAGDSRQAYYAGIAKPREVAHDARLYRAYSAAATRLHESGARVRRVVLDYELKREYQRFLQQNNHDHRRASGRPDRSRDEVHTWATGHGLPLLQGRVQFPDVRIEYDRPDGRRDHEDLELATEHYNTRQMAAKRAAGFQIHASGAGRIGGGKSRAGARPFDPHAAEELLR